MPNDICITLDYELCLGAKTGSVKNSLILPMDELSKVFDRYNVKVTIMVDSSYLLMLKKNMSEFGSLEVDYNMIVSQLKSLSLNGHSIQLHIHPQWYYSSYDGENWYLDFEHYKLSDMDKEDVEIYFKESKSLLESIIGKKVVAFRAGGFSLQTYKEHGQLFASNDIKIDTSAVPGNFEKSKHQWYDYRNLPHQNYKFSHDITKINENGRILEIPISTVRINPIHYLYLRKKVEFPHNSFKPFSEGLGIVMNYSRFRRWWNVFKQIFRTKFAGASMDNFSSRLLPFIYERYTSISENNCFVIIGHPKSASPRSIYFTEKFIKNTFKNNNYKTLEDFII